MRHQILLIHTDAGVGDSEGFVLLVQFQVYPGVEWERLVRVSDKGQMAERIDRVGLVGNQFTKEDFGMRIERVDDQLQQLIDFSLKFTFRHRSRSPIGKYKTPECRIHPRIWTVEERHGNGAESAPLGWLPLFPPPRNRVADGLAVVRPRCVRRKARFTSSFLAG